MNCTDKVAAGAVTIVCGIGGAVQGWPYIPGSLVGVGIGTLLAGLLQARAER